MNGKIILVGILGSIILTGCGQQKEEIKDINELTGANNLQTSTGNVNTGNESKTSQATGDTQPKDINTIAKETLLDYYSKLNQGKYDEALNYYSNGLRNFSTIKKEFSVEKLTKFYKAIDNDLTISNITQIDSGNPKIFTYSVYYEINGTLYNEMRRLALKYNEKDIAKPWEVVQIMCDKNCEKYPFFNMKKFGLE